jgi:hypothetical protein
LRDYEKIMDANYTEKISLRSEFSYGANMAWPRFSLAMVNGGMAAAAETAPAVGDVAEMEKRGAGRQDAAAGCVGAGAGIEPVAELLGGAASPLVLALSLLLGRRRCGQVGEGELLRLVLFGGFFPSRSAGLVPAALSTPLSLVEPGRHAGGSGSR